jgi:hypothetical protein
MRLVERNTLVKTDLEKVKNSQSCEENFNQLFTNFFTFFLTTQRKFFLDFLNNFIHEAQVFAFNLDPVS